MNLSSLNLEPIALTYTALRDKANKSLKQENDLPIS